MIRTLVNPFFFAKRTAGPVDALAERGCVNCAHLRVLLLKASCIYHYKRKTLHTRWKRPTRPLSEHKHNRDNSAAGNTDRTSKGLKKDERQCLRGTTNRTTARNAHRRFSYAVKPRSSSFIGAGNTLPRPVHDCSAPSLSLSVATTKKQPRPQDTTDI